MSPEERQLLSSLFERTRNAGATPRDAEAEALIADQVKAQPYAPYLLAQAVIVQEQALKAANDKLQALEAHVQELQQAQASHAPSGGAPASSGFLSGLGSLFGAGNPPPPPSAPRGPAANPWQQPQQGFGQQQPPYQQPYPPQGPGPAPGPWGAAPQGGGGGGFLKGALGAAAGVAGGVLLADSIRGLFGGHNNPLGIASGMGGLNPGGVGGETVINNYYEDNDQGSRDNDVADNDRDDDAADASYDDDANSDDSDSDDGSYDV